MTKGKENEMKLKEAEERRNREEEERLARKDKLEMEVHKKRNSWEFCTEFKVFLDSTYQILS